MQLSFDFLNLDSTLSPQRAMRVAVLLLKTIGLDAQPWELANQKALKLRMGQCWNLKVYILSCLGARRSIMKPKIETKKLGGRKLTSVTTFTLSSESLTGRRAFSLCSFWTFLGITKFSLYPRTTCWIRLSNPMNMKKTCERWLNI